MRVNLEIENGIIIGYRKFPIDEDTSINVTRKQLELIDNNIGRIDENFNILQIDDNENYLDSLREKRYEILNAFDIYKSNVNYGILEETNEEKEEIISWYKKILDLDEEAINNIHLKVKQYM